jgi:hypothetical protein
MSKFLSPILIGFLLMLSTYSNAQSKDSVILEVLKHAKQNMDQLFSDHPEEFKQFSKGVINKDSMSLEYHIAPSSEDMLNEKIEGTPDKIHAPSYFQGIRFRFYTNISRPQARIRPYFAWLGINTYLVAGFSWPNSSFGFKEQTLVTEAFDKACRPLFQLENYMLESALINLDESDLILEGEQNMRFNLRLDTNTVAHHLLALYGTPNVQTHVTKNFIYRVLVENRVYQVHLPKGFVHGVRLDRHNPFRELSGGETQFLGYVNLPKLPPGEHSIRVIAALDQDQWLDRTPTVVDGQPVLRKVAPCWTGIFISSELRVKIGSKGEILLAL